MKPLFLVAVVIGSSIAFTAKGGTTDVSINNGITGQATYTDGGQSGDPRSGINELGA